MLYIDTQSREVIDPAIDALLKKICHFADDEVEGVLNYIITSILNRRFTLDGRWRYKKINRAIGVLECVKLEFYRRLAGPYEDSAINKNGDIQCYDQFKRGHNEQSSIPG